MKNMNSKAVLLFVGLAVGGIVGFLTRPGTTEIQIGPMNIQVTGPGPAQGGPLTSNQIQHIALLAILGAVIGFGVGYVVERGGVRS
jgi:hypothetical protein